MTAANDAPSIGLVVEGPGDKEAFPVLLRKYLADNGIYDVALGKPVPLKGKGSATRPGGVEGYVMTAGARPNCKAVIVLVDADNDASCELGPTLLARASGATKVPVVVVVAERDFEDWIYASLETLELGDAQWLESTRGKSAIESLVAPKKYVKATMQARLTHRVDIAMARERSTSLNRLFNKLDGILESF